MEPAQPVILNLCFLSVEGFDPPGVFEGEEVLFDLLFGDFILGSEIVGDGLFILKGGVWFFFIGVVEG